MFEYYLYVQLTQTVGEYRVNGEIIYEGGFCDGAMHGKGRLLFDTGEIWAGKFWKVKLLRCNGRHMKFQGLRGVC